MKESTSKKKQTPSKKLTEKEKLINEYNEYITKIIYAATLAFCTEKAIGYITNNIHKKASGENNGKR